jgi:hypothetical protein
VKFYTSLSKTLKPYFETELKKYQIEYSKGNLKSAWNYLERAHIIGQKYLCAPILVHWKMLQFRGKIKNTKEILGQIPRLIFGGVKSFVGKIPVGNPRGAAVLPLKPFPIEKELQNIFVKAGISLTC